MKEEAEKGEARRASVEEFDGNQVRVFRVFFIEYSDEEKSLRQDLSSKEVL
jgi:hypothetical protein